MEGSILTINELKALAYDKIALIEQYQRSIGELQRELVQINSKIIQLQSQDERL